MSDHDHGPRDRPRLAIVVNAPGLQERRADALQRGLAPSWEVTVAVAPSPMVAAALARDCDVVYVIDPGKRGFPAGLVSRLVPRVGSVVEIGDPQAALYAAQGRSRPEVLLGRVLDGVSVRTADHLVFRGRDLADSLEPRRPWTFIPDGVDMEVFAPTDPTALREELGFPGDSLVAGVVGSITWAEQASWAYGLDIVEALASTPATVRALIVGDGNGLTHLRRRASDLGVSDRVVFTGRRPHAEVPALLSAMDVCVSTQSDDEIGRGRTTAKLPEYLACDRFVLATAVGTAADLLPPEMLMPATAAGDRRQSHALAERLTELDGRRADLHGGAGTRDIALREFSYDHVVDAVDVVARGVLRAR